jgi:tetratricopeptide (TPR) repeat protein
MSAPARNAALAAVALAALLAGGWSLVRPRPVLDRDRFDALVAGRRFASAEGLLRAHLARAPRDPEAGYLLAELLLERPASAGGVDEPGAREALALLARVRPDSPRRAALARMYEGKAHYRLARWTACEAAMLDARRLDPAVPEAGWVLLDLYYLQGRTREAARLGLELHRVEPDPRDRALLLLELVRQDAQPPDAASIVAQAEPVVAAEPDATRPPLTLGAALIRNSKIADGLETLRAAVAAHPGAPEAWDSLLTGLDDAGQPEAVGTTLAGLPAALRDDARFARHLARAAQDRADWPEAVRQYRRARAFDPADPMLVYRLARALRFARQPAEADALARAHEAYKAALPDLKALYEEADATPTLGVAPHPDLVARMADLRDRMLRPEEARAWRTLPGGTDAATAPATATEEGHP